MALERDVAASVVALAAFSLWQTWQGVAPSIQDLRGAHRTDRAVRTQLMDADIMLGSLTILVAIAMTVYTGDKSILVLMALSFGILSLWSHMVLNSEQLTPERNVTA